MDLSALTLTQLRYLVAVDAERSFRAAATRCHVSQPALSMQVHRAEELLGVVVFDRSQQPIVATQRGSAILEHARDVLRAVERLGEVASAERELSGTYRLGVIPTLAATLLPLFLPRFSEDFPNVHLVVEEVQTETMITRLLADSLDGGIAATPLESAGIHETALYTEELFAYLPRRHPLTRQDRVHQSELVSERLWLLAEGHCFRSQVMQLCRIDRAALGDGAGNLRFESGSFETLIELVNDGFGVTVLPELTVQRLPAARRRAQVRRFAGRVPVRDVGFIFAREHLRRSVTDAIISTVKESLPMHTLPKSRKLLAPT